VLAKDPMGRVLEEFPVGQKIHDAFWEAGQIVMFVLFQTHEVWILDGSLKFFFSWTGICIL